MSQNTSIHERNIALQALYKRIIHSQVNKNLLTTDAIVSIVIEQPAPRFYLGPHQAELLIIHYYNEQKKCASCKRTLKREMVEDLVQNYERLRNIYPHTPKDRIFEMVVEQPAKLFYVTHRVAKEVIFNYTGRNGKK